MTPAARLLAEIRLRSVRPFGTPPYRPPSDDTIERQFQTELRKGYTKKKNPTCPGCGVMKSNTGSCFC